MTRKTDSINTALFDLIAGVDGYTPMRNVTLAKFDGDRFVSFIDAESGTPVEEYINADVYEFEATASLIVAIEAADESARRAFVNNAIDAFGAALDADPSLGGLVTAMRANVAETDTVQLFGTADMSAAEITIELDYWTNSPLG